MRTNRDIVAGAFHAWMDGTGYVASIFADDMTWEITGRSAASKKYSSTRQFLDEVLHPFGARFARVRENCCRILDHLMDAESVTALRSYRYGPSRAAGMTAMPSARR